MPKAKAKTFFGAGDYGRAQFKEALEQDIYFNSEVPKVSWAKFCAFMAEQGNEEEMFALQNQAVDILYEGFKDKIVEFLEREGEALPE